MQLSPGNAVGVVRYPAEWISVRQYSTIVDHRLNDLVDVIGDGPLVRK